MPSKTAINLSESKGFTKEFKKTLFKQSLNYLSAFAVVVGSTFVPMNAANAAAITMVTGETAIAADNTVNSPAAMSINDDYTVAGGDVGFNTASSLMSIKSLTSGTGDTVATLTGTGGFTITGALVADQGTAELTLVVNDNADNAVSLAGINTLAIIKLDTASVLNYTGAVTHTGSVTGAADGDGTININAATTHSGAIGADAVDMGTININSATTLGTANVATFSRDVNVLANTILTGDLNANTVDITTGATTTVTISNKFLKASGSSSVMTMNLTGQIIKVNTADVISGDLRSVTDGFGKVQVTVNNTNMTGNIGTSTTAKIGALDMDKDLSTTGNIFVDATNIATAEVLTIAGDNNNTITGTINGDGAVQGNIVVNSGGDATKIATFTGDLGNTQELKLMTLTTEATFEGNVKVDNIDIAAATAAVFKKNLTIGAADLSLGDATATATFSGTTTQTIIGGAGGEDIIGTGIVQISNTSNEGVNFGAHAHLAANTLQLKLAANAVLTNSVSGHVMKDVTTLAGSSIVLDDNLAASDVVFTTTDTLTKDSIHASSFIKMPANFEMVKQLYFLIMY